MGRRSRAIRWGSTGVHRAVLDEETGLYYYRARMYSAGLGRFCQRDPIGFAPSANLFEYVSSQPTGRVDPLGLADEPYKAESPGWVR